MIQADETGYLLLWKQESCKLFRELISNIFCDDDLDSQQIYFCMSFSGKAYQELKKCQIVERPVWEVFQMSTLWGFIPASLDKLLAMIQAHSDILFDLQISNTFLT